MLEEVQYPKGFSQEVKDLLQQLLHKDPSKRIDSVSAIKKHKWLSDVNWDLLLRKEVDPSIIPNVQECCIDPDYVELPLDFEESVYKVRLETERRYSYYYESTIQTKSVTE